MALAALAGAAGAACVSLAPPGGAPLARIALDERDPAFRITYVHSVTRTPVDEIYRVDGSRVVQTEIRFVEHGPGLPTAADASGTFELRDGRFVVHEHRAFAAFVMRVHRDQRPILVAGAHTVDLAQWGNRALELSASAGECAAP